MIKIINTLTIIIIFFNIFEFGNGAADQCTPYKCQGLYQSCSKPGQICSEGLYCRGDPAVCFSKNVEFDNCYDDTQCNKGTVCVTRRYDKYCKEVGFRGNGEDCYITEECAIGLDCMNNTCTKSPQQCTKYSCPFGKYCSSKKVCVSYIENGEVCDPLEPHCLPGSLCSGNYQSSICVPAYSKNAGESCDNDNSCDIGQGLGCKNGVCTKYHPEKDNKVYCLDDSACFIGIEQCICNNVTQSEGKCQQTTKIGRNCTDAFHKYHSCMMDNNCPIDIQNPYSPRSCQSKNCNQELCNYQATCMILEYSCQRYLMNEECTPTPNFSISIHNEIFNLTSILSMLISITFMIFIHTSSSFE